MAEVRAGLKKVEAEILTATGVDESRPSDAAVHADFGQLMASFHESASAELLDIEVRHMQVAALMMLMHRVVTDLEPDHLASQDELTDASSGAHMSKTRVGFLSCIGKTVTCHVCGHRVWSADARRVNLDPACA